MSQREWSSTASVFGFNGMRKDEEWQGSGNAYDFGARIYDPRLGRWLARDPLAGKFPSWSPYSYGFDNPNYFTDPTGKWPTPNLLDGYSFNLAALTWGWREWQTKQKDGSYTTTQEFHYGLDMATGKKEGIGIRAAAGGTVVHVGDLNNGYGVSVIIDHGNGYFTRYAHLAEGSALVVEGQQITDGTIIGEAGNTGKSKGIHLHFEIHYVENYSGTFIKQGTLKTPKEGIESGKSTAIDPRGINDLEQYLLGNNANGTSTGSTTTDGTDLSDPRYANVVIPPVKEPLKPGETGCLLEGAKLLSESLKNQLITIPQKTDHLGGDASNQY